MQNVLRSPDGQVQPNTGVRFISPHRAELDTSDPNRWVLDIVTRNGEDRRYVILGGITGMMLIREDRPG